MELDTIAKFIVILFGVFVICVGILMLVKPEKAIGIIRKAGSTNLVNYVEITVRMIPAAALILISDQSKYPEIFKLFGWFMLATSFALFFIPRNLHHKFALLSANMLKPVLLRVISPFAILLGFAIIYAVV